MPFFEEIPESLRNLINHRFCEMCNSEMDPEKFSVLKPSGFFKAFKNAKDICESCNREIKLKKLLK